jgi:tryptophan-rich sensory protein
VNLDLIFKRLVLIDVAIISFFIALAVFIPESEVVSDFNLNIPEQHNFYYILIFVWLIIFYISIYLLYNFKPLGKQLYLANFIFVILLDLFGGPVALDEWVYVIDILTSALSGAILVLLYFSPLKKKFNKQK